jgi:hypothetical protein
VQNNTGRGRGRAGESANDAKTRKAKEARAKRMERKRKGTEPQDEKLTRLQKRKVCAHLFKQ